MATRLVSFKLHFKSSPAVYQAQARNLTSSCSIQFARSTLRIASRSSGSREVPWKSRSFREVLCGGPKRSPRQRDGTVPSVGWSRTTPKLLSWSTPLNPALPSVLSLAPSDAPPSPWLAVGAFVGLPLALWAYKVTVIETIIIGLTKLKCEMLVRHACAFPKEDHLHGCVQCFLTWRNSLLSALSTLRLCASRRAISGASQGC